MSHRIEGFLGDQKNLFKKKNDFQALSFFAFVNAWNKIVQKVDLDMFFANGDHLQR